MTGLEMDIVFEAVRAAVTGLIFVLVLKSSTAPNLKKNREWRRIIIGLGLVFFGSLIDITDNFPPLDKFIIIGDTKAEAFLEKVVGYTGGFIMFAWGLRGWLPFVGSLQQGDEELMERYSSAEKTLSWLWKAAETTPFGITVTDIKRKIVYTNPADAAMHGYSVDELIGKDSRLFSGMKSGYEMTEEEVKSIRRWQRETKNIKCDGIEFDVRLVSDVVKDERGDAIGIVTVCEDITERRNAEKQLEKYRLHLEDLVEEKTEELKETIGKLEIEVRERRRAEEEKEKLLRDLHDGIGGITTNIRLLAEIALRTGSIDEMKKVVSTISNLSMDSMSEIRSMMRSLESKGMSWESLAVELRSVGMNIVEPHNMHFDMETGIDDAVEIPGPLLTHNLFRIYREALTNIIKHSNATKVVVAFNIRKQSVSLSITDNGIGFDEKADRGRGIINMQTRAREMGGLLTVKQDGGTGVLLEFPITDGGQHEASAVPGRMKNEAGHC